MGEPGIETEVKFRVPHLAALRANVIARGGQVTQPRHLERNVLFDDAERSLARRGCLLRLRSALDTRLTLKAPAPPNSGGDQHKRRVEHETTLGDYDTAFAILSGLGYAPAWRYEKYRESFRLGEVTVSLDHTPIGDFIEIEGPAESIRPAAEQLALEWDQRNLQTYRELFLEAGPGDRTDMTF